MLKWKGCPGVRFFLNTSTFVSASKGIVDVKPSRRFFIPYFSPPEGLSGHGSMLLTGTIALFLNFVFFNRFLMLTIAASKAVFPSSLERRRSTLFIAANKCRGRS